MLERGGGDEKGIVRIKCLVQEHNTMTQPGVEPRPLWTNQVPNPDFRTQSLAR